MWAAIEWGSGSAVNRITFEMPLDNYKDRVPLPQVATTRSAKGRTEFTFFHLLRNIQFSLQDISLETDSRLWCWYNDHAVRGEPFRFYEQHDGDSYVNCTILPGWTYNPEWQAKYKTKMAFFSFLNQDYRE